MKIITYGSVTFQHSGPIKIEGWNVEREPSDPVDATDEELLLDLVITWAKEMLRKSVNRAVMDVAAQRQSGAMPGSAMVDISEYEKFRSGN